MFTYPSIKIVLLKNDVNKKNECPIYLQFIHQRRTFRLSLRKFVPLASWNGVHPKYLKDKGPDKHPNARQLNILLAGMQNKAQEIILAYEIENKAITWELFQQEMNPGAAKPQTFYDFHMLYVEEQRKEGTKVSTLETYSSKLKKLREFAPELNIEDVTAEFAREYIYWMKTVKGNVPNTIYKSFQYLTAVCRLAVRMKALKEYPLEGVAVRKEVRDPSRLNQAEVDKLMALYRSGVLPDSRQNVLGQFLFACHTGLAFGDIQVLDYADIQVHTDGTLYVEKDRNKTDIRFICPLLPEALELIDYPNEGKVFRGISNKNTNDYIQDTCKFVGIQRHVRFHTARHTFGTIAINKGIRLEVVQKMMGHAKASMTSHYAKLNTSTIIEEGLKPSK